MPLDFERLIVLLFDILPAASGEDSYGVRVGFTPISSVGSSHNRPTSAEDCEEALLWALPGPRSFGQEKHRGTTATPTGRYARINSLVFAGALAGPQSWHPVFSAWSESRDWTGKASTAGPFDNFRPSR
jgi:hypothetical protein